MLFKNLSEFKKKIHTFNKFLFSKILDIDFKEAHFIEHYFNYIEMRERRNLIVHRGTIYDDIYFKTIICFD